MKILLLCNKIPYPPFDGGAIATLNMAESLATNGQQVTILAMSTWKHSHQVSEIPDELRDRIKFIYINVDTRIRFVKFLFNLIFSDQPYNASRFFDKGFVNVLSLLLQEESFDIVQLEGLYLKPYMVYIRKYYKGVLSYRAHNIESEIWQRMAHSARNPVRRIYFAILARRISRYEKDMINRYDILVSISADDLESLQKMGNSGPCVLIPTGIPDSNFKSQENRTATDLFYIGALDWIPNQEALIWFCDKVWGPLRNRLSELSFHVAGRNAPAWLSGKLSGSGIYFHGEIRDAREFIDSHSVMVVPLFAGSGLRIKIIEAMARSKPVVTSRIGAQGLNADPGSEILLAETADEWIQTIGRLIDNRSLFHGLQKNAYMFACENFSNDRIVKKLLYFYLQQTSS